MKPEEMIRRGFELRDFDLVQSGMMLYFTTKETATADKCGALVARLSKNNDERLWYSMEAMRRLLSAAKENNRVWSSLPRLD